MNRRPCIELLTPDLSIGIPFIPGYDLLEKERQGLSAEDLASIARSGSTVSLR